MDIRAKTVIFLMRENKSVKRIKLSPSKTAFKYKKGKYYLQERGCFLKNKKIYLFYFEGIPNPISFDNIKPNLPKDGEDAELKIDSTVIKDMTEKDFLNALTQTSIEKLDMIYLMLGVFSLCISVVTLYFVYNLYQVV